MQIPSYLHHKEPPRALQELFAGPSTLDIRLEQQRAQYQQEKQQQQHHQQQPPNQQQQQTKSNDFSEMHLNKRTSIDVTNNGQSNDDELRNNDGINSPNLPSLVPHGLASQLMLRSARGQRQYDVPQIGK